MRIVVSFMSIFFMVALVAGCSSPAPEVKKTSTDVTVYGSFFDPCNATGSPHGVVLENMEIHLVDKDDYGNDVDTRTDSSGYFEFSNVENGYPPPLITFLSYVNPDATNPDAPDHSGHFYNYWNSLFHLENEFPYTSNSLGRTLVLGNYSSYMSGSVTLTGYASASDYASVKIKVEYNNDSVFMPIEQDVDGSGDWGPMAANETCYSITASVTDEDLTIYPAFGWSNLVHLDDDVTNINFVLHQQNP